VPVTYTQYIEVSGECQSMAKGLAVLG